jgi:iron(III) transport system substrate-binding protein
MLRYLWIILFGLVLATPFVMRAVLVRGAGAEARGAAGDGGELVIVTPHTQDIRRAFAAAFADWHRERFGTTPRVTYLTPGGTNDIIRLLSDRYGTPAFRAADGSLKPEAEVAAQVTIDIAWGGGDVVFDRDLKPVLKPISVDASVFKAAFPKPDLNGVALYERTRDGAAPKWVGTVLSSFGIVYNPTLYARMNLPPPQTWRDLDRPELEGLVALADPTRSGSVAVAYMMAIQRARADAEAALLEAQPALRQLSASERERHPEYRAALAAGWKRGMRTLLLMAANARYFTDSASQVPNDVGNGDAAAGVAIDFYGRVFEQEVGRERIRYVAPRGATAITPDPIGILYGVVGERELLANRFVEFLLTPQAQRLWNLRGGQSPYLPRSLRRLPIRPDVYADRTGWADDTNPFEESGGFNMRGQWMSLFTDTRPIWAAAWIDSRTALKETYRSVLEVPDPHRRAQLIEKLSDLPIEMADVEAQKKTRGEMEKNREDVRLWMTRERIRWAEAFRTHYHSVAEAAEGAKVGMEPQMNTDAHR